MRFSTFTVLAPGVMALGLALSSGTALAAGPDAGGAAQVPGAQQQAATPVSDAEIDQFITAANEIQVLHQDAQAKLSSATDETEAAELRQEAEQEMHAAIEDSGLTLQRYQEIFVAYQSDPQVNEKVTRKMDQ